jgi:hypothetical protein
METIFHTTIKTEPIANNGGSKFGFNAVCSAKYGENGFSIDISQHGKTESEAKEKLIAFLTENGLHNTEEVECL